MTKHPAPLDRFNFAGLLAGRIARIHYARAALSVEGLGVDRRFVMTGPSGRHTLVVEATDLDRLNAHWLTFAAHDKNRAA